MTTECNQFVFGFHPQKRREIRAQFDGGTITSDGGGLLLREVEKRIRIHRQFAVCFTDYRDPDLIEHTVEELVAQRVYGLALGYEDLNDHEELRNDPLLAVLVEKADPGSQVLAGKSTLNRLELTKETASRKERYKKIVLDHGAVDRLLVEVFLEAHREAPKEIILDLDATDDPLHGHQEGRFFHGYYDGYCYLPLYIFAGEHLLCAKLRRANIDGAAGATEEIERIVAQIRTRWRKVKIILRADSGFCREQMMQWCEKNAVEYVFGLARNCRLVRSIGAELRQAKAESRQTQRPARRFKELVYRTRKSWCRPRRVVAKAERTGDKANPRFIVTNLSIERWAARELYEDLYCARGECENRIKEAQLDLFADRLSAATFRANQLRLWFASAAYVLMHALRRVGLVGTALARACANTIRLRLLKIGAVVTVSVRRVKLAMSEACANQREFIAAFHALSAAAR